MFYVPVILGKKGPLSVVWLAAHIDKKVSKSQVLNTDISAIIDLLLNSQLKISLRVTSDLMVGLCRIHKRQTMYFFDDCRRVFELIQRLFNQIDKKHKIDLPESKRQAQLVNINLPEIFEFMDLNLPEMQPIPDKVRHVSRHSITLNEIPKLTDEEIREEDELNKQIYDFGDENKDNLSPVDTFFEDFLPPPQLQQQDMSFNIPISDNDIQYTTIISPPQENVIDAFIPPSTSNEVNKADTKSSAKVPEFTTSLEKGRHKLASISRDLIGDIQLEPLGQSSQFSRSQIRPKKRRKIRSLIIDNIIKISDYEMRRALRPIPPNMIVLDICPTMSPLDDFNFHKPNRSLPNPLKEYFTKAFNNHPFIDDHDDNTFVDEQQEDVSMLQLENIVSSKIPKEVLTTMIEKVGPIDSMQIDDVLFDEPLPPPQMADDYDDMLPEIREDFDANEHIQQLTHYTFNQPSTTDMDRSHIRSLFDSKIDDIFSVQDYITFAEFIPPDSNKMTAAIFFFNLLATKNSELVDVSQIESYDLFNEILICRLDRPYTPSSMPI